MTDLTDPLPPPARTLHTTEDVAAMLHVTPGAVRVMHTRGTGPPSIKVGRRRLYPAAQFTDWLEQHP